MPFGSSLSFQFPQTGGIWSPNAWSGITAPPSPVRTRASAGRSACGTTAASALPNSPAWTANACGRPVSCTTLAATGALARTPGPPSQSAVARLAGPVQRAPRTETSVGNFPVATGADAGTAGQDSASSATAWGPDSRGSDAKRTRTSVRPVRVGITERAQTGQEGSG